MKQGNASIDALPAKAARMVRERLARIAGEHEVHILHAIESGSRAWGFPSPDSDYDARFIYAHPADWYFSVFEQRDVIETPIEDVDGIVFDVNGWDLRKALRLLARSNPVLIEWLQSPIVYAGADGFRDEMLDLARRFHSLKASHYHYLHMARNNYREHLLGETVKLKKYFYVLRPVLACQWIEHGLGLPPMQLTELLAGVVPPGVLRDEILRLRELKMATPEFGADAPIPVIHDFLERELKRLADVSPQAPAPKDSGALNDFLRRWAVSSP